MFARTTGGFHVTLSGEQILKGIHGGAEGINIHSNNVLGYLYMSILVNPPCEPILIRRQTPIPVSNYVFLFTCD